MERLVFEAVYDRPSRDSDRDKLTCTSLTTQPQ